MARSKSITFKGPAAMAALVALSGQSKTPEQEMESVAIGISIAVKDGNMAGAVRLLDAVMKHGAKEARAAIDAARDRYDLEANKVHSVESHEQCVAIVKALDEVIAAIGATL